MTDWWWLLKLHDNRMTEVMGEEKLSENEIVFTNPARCYKYPYIAHHFKLGIEKCSCSSKNDNSSQQRNILRDRECVWSNLAHTRQRTHSYNMSHISVNFKNRFLSVLPFNVVLHKWNQFHALVRVLCTVLGLYEFYEFIMNWWL